MSLRRDFIASLKHIEGVTPASGNNGKGEFSEDERDFFEERSAIMQYDGGLPKKEAEDAAAVVTRYRRNGDPAILRDNAAGDPGARPSHPNRGGVA